MIYSHKALHYLQMNIGKLKIGNSVELMFRRNGFMFFCAETTSASLTSVTILFQEENTNI